MANNEVVALGFDLPCFQELTPKEQLFIMHPLVMEDPIKAAVDAGYAETTAKAKGHQMRQQLLYFIKPLIAKRMEQQEVTYESLVYVLRCIAFAKNSDYFDTVDVEGDTVKVYKDVTRLPDHMQRAIKAVETETVILPSGEQFQRISRIELHDPLAAVKQLRELGAFDGSKPGGNSEQEIAGHMSAQDRATVEEIYKRAADKLAASRAKTVEAKVIADGRKKDKR